MSKEKTTEATWIDYWNLTFPPPLKPGEVIAFQKILESNFTDLTSHEIIQAIIDLGQSTHFDKYGNKPYQLRTQIRQNRNKNGQHELTPIPELEMQLRKKLRLEPDPSRRWDIICDETPDDVEGVRMCDRLYAYGCKLEGGVKRFNFRLNKLPKKLGDKPDDEETEEEINRQKAEVKRKLREGLNNV